METGRSGTRRSVHFKGQTVFLETEVKKTHFFRSGELEKYLKKLGAKVEEYLTPNVDYLVTNDKDKVFNGQANNAQSPNPPQSPARPSLQPTIYESRAQKTLRLAMEKSNPRPPSNSTKRGKNEKNQKILHIDDFAKLVKRRYAALRRSNESKTTISTVSPKPANYKTPQRPTISISPSKIANPRDRAGSVSMPESRLIQKPFLRIDDIDRMYKPIWHENIPIPVLRLDRVENDGCPFEGYEKKSSREAKRKIAKKLRGGCCEICDEKFSDEEVHVKSEKHLKFLAKRKKDFDILKKNCEKLFPDGFDGFLNRLDEFNNSPTPSPIPISVLTEPESESINTEPVCSIPKTTETAITVESDSKNQNENDAFMNQVQKSSENPSQNERDNQSLSVKKSLPLVEKRKSRKSTMEIYRELDDSSQDEEMSTAILQEPTKTDKKKNRKHDEVKMNRNCQSDERTQQSIYSLQENKTIDEFNSTEILEALSDLRKEKADVVMGGTGKCEDDAFTKYREPKKNESSFETSKTKSQSESPSGTDDPDWMFRENPTETLKSDSSESNSKSRKTSEDTDWMLLEIEKLGKMKKSEISEFESDVPKVKNPERDENSYLSHGKRKTTPAKGTYNPQSSNIGILDQLGTSNTSNLCTFEQSDAKKSEILQNSEVTSKKSAVTSVDRSSPLFSSTSTSMSPILPLSLKYPDIISRVPLQSPKPAPVKLNLEAGSAFSPVRSPALKKAIVETGSGRKREIATLRNLRSDFNQIIEEEPKSTISAATNIDTVPKPQLTPLPPPVMSAVLVSPKEKKTASTTASPLDGKQFANLQNTRRSTDKIPNANQQQSRISNISSKLTKPSEDLSMTLEIEYDDHLTEPTTIISHADQFEFKTPTKNRIRNQRERLPPGGYEEESSPFPFSPASELSSNPSIVKSCPSSKKVNPSIVPYSQSPAKLIYQDFASIPRKASFESEDGRPDGEVQLCMDKDDTDGGSSIISTSIICDPEHEIITTKSGKVKKRPEKKNIAPSSALRGLDQSVIFRDSPRQSSRRSKLNAVNGISANYNFLKRRKLVYRGNMSSENNSPVRNRDRRGRRDRSTTILKREENVFTLQAFAYEPDDHDDSFDSPVKEFSKRSHRKTHSAAKNSIARSLEIEQLLDSGLINHQQLEAQKQIMNMSPESKKLYYSGSKKTNGKAKAAKTKRNNALRTPSPAANEIMYDMMPTTPENNTTASNSDDDFFQNPPQRLSTRKLRKEQQHVRCPKPARRHPERSCRTRMDRPKYGFVSSDED